MNSNERTVYNTRIDKAINSVGTIKRAPLDQFDMEAEREGSARRYFSSNDLRPVMGRRIGREIRQRDGYNKTVQAKSTKNIVKDTAKIYNRIVLVQK